MFEKYLKKLITFGVLVYAGCGQGAEILGNIYIEGNDITKAHVITQELIVHPGDVLNIERVNDSIQYVMDLGLFEKVNHRLEKDELTGKIDLYIQVKERYYLFVLPSLKQNENNEIEYGFRTRWDNVFGLNHRLEWKLLDTGSELDVNEFRNQFEYVIPRINESKIQLSLIIKQERNVFEDETFGFQDQEESEYGFGLDKWLSKKHNSSGVFIGGSMVKRERLSAAIFPGDASKGDFNAIVYSFRIGYQNVHEYKYNRDGVSVLYFVDLADEKLGTDLNSEFVKYEFDYRSYVSLDKTTGKNFNMRLVFGSANNEELGNPAFSLGGTSNLRGYDANTFVGDAMVFVTLEYLSTLYSDSYLRKVIFLDVGDTYASLSDFDLSKLKYDVGVGIRWKIKKFVDLNVRMEAAYGFETSETRFILSARHPF